MMGSVVPRAALVLILALLGPVACGGGEPAAPAPSAPTLAAPIVAADETSYQVAAGDRIRVTVFRHEDLSGEYALDGAGNFAMPLIGEVKGNGLNTRQLEDRIEGHLREGYLIDPQVSVEVLNYRPFYILGEVRSPGSYPYVNGMTVLNAVVLGGDFTYRADKDDILLRRGGSNTPPVQATLDTPIQPGDIIEVTERFF
jgi:protein involved in polysaccharide export with SLBB domain